MSKRPTIIDVARHAGVSKSAVSLVLQNSPQVKPSTRDTVMQSICTLNYVYNRTAASLRSAKAGLIGLIINDLRNPFFAEFASSAQMACAARDYATVIANTDEDPAMQARVIDSMIEHGVSGLLISSAFGIDTASFDRIAALGIPMMQVLRKVDARTEQFPLTSMDYATDSRLAAEHLIELGARNIAFIGGLEDRGITLERTAGFLEVLQTRGLAPHIFRGWPARAFGRDTAIRLHEEYPQIEAAACFNDLVALGMIAGFARIGVEVGKDFRLVGFDDIEECDLVYPPLSSIRCDIARFGRQSAETLLEWLEHDEKPAAVRLQPVKLITRQSSLG